MSDRWHLRPLSDIVDLRHPSGRPGATGRRSDRETLPRDTVREGAAMERTRVSVRGIDASGCRRAVGLALAMIAALAVLQPEPARAQAARSPAGRMPRNRPSPDTCRSRTASSSTWSSTGSTPMPMPGRSPRPTSSSTGAAAGARLRISPPGHRGGVQPRPRLAPSHPARVAHRTGQAASSKLEGAPSPAGAEREEPDGESSSSSRGGDRPEVMPRVRGPRVLDGQRRGAESQRAGADALHPLEGGEGGLGGRSRHGDLVLAGQDDLVLSVLDGKAPSIDGHPYARSCCGSRTASSRSRRCSLISPPCRRCRRRPCSSASTG